MKQNVSCHSNTNLSVTQPDLLSTVERHLLVLLHPCKSSENNKLKPSRFFIFSSIVIWTNFHCKKEIIRGSHEDTDQTGSLLLPTDNGIRGTGRQQKPAGFCVRECCHLD